MTQLEGSSGGSGGSKPSGGTSESVEFLPDPSEAKKDVIYVVEDNDNATEDNSYKEYIVVNGKWEKLGSNPLTVKDSDVLGLFD